MNQFTAALETILCTAPVTALLKVNGVNKTFRVTTNTSDFFARFSPLHYQTFNDIRFEKSVLSTLTEASAPCCTPFAVNGESVFGPFLCDQNEYTVLLTKTIEGTPLQADQIDARFFGSSLAKIHSVAVPAHLVGRIGINRSTKIKSPFRSVAHDLLNYSQSSNPVVEATTICHGDAWTGNALSMQETPVLFDFEYTYIGDPLYDIGTYAWHLMSEDCENSNQVFESFLDGYRSTRELKYKESDLRRQIALKEYDTIAFMSKNITLGDDLRDAILSSACKTLKKLKEKDRSLFL